jgi:hypothetical protein
MDLIEVKLSPVFRERFPRRSAHVFIHGDGLKSADVDGMLNALNVTKFNSTICAVRKPYTPPFTDGDIVVSGLTPTYTAIEKEAMMFKKARGYVVLKDVIFICPVAFFSLYKRFVARAVSFADANVIVCCPERFDTIHEADRRN